MSNVTIERFMTKAPHTIGSDQTLTTAHRMMRRFRIRHLPVLTHGNLVGILSQRDLHFIETLSGVDPDQVMVDEAMTEEIFTITPETSVETAATEMADHKFGCAVVMDAGHVVGVFTTIDALRALSAVLSAERTATGTVAALSHARKRPQSPRGEARKPS
jgi:acetoin utilization protein AcuB